MKRRSVLTKGRFAKINRRFAMSETLFRQSCFAKGTKKGVSKMFRNALYLSVFANFRSCRT